ncbi:MAG: putative sulfate exporter family transporter [Sphingobacteriales bacterium]|nr:MAG: putative sulfate exporter family transporter [Sphingobacteriales bacterium]
MIHNDNVRKAIFLFCVVLCLTPWVTPPIALFLGLLVAQFMGHPYQQHNKKITTYLLQYSIVGLGFGMNIETALKAGSQGFIFTIVSILGTLLLGTVLGRLFKIDKKTSHLISSGTAICGGSAIAAVAPVIRAEEQQISVSLGIVFILNSIALFVFPYIGQSLGLTGHQFGLWCAIAIHDTSSVVGAASAYKIGTQEAIEVATTVKLARALWIIPLALVSTMFFKEGKQKIKIPYFIGGFILAMIIYTYVPAIHPISGYIVAIAKKGLTVTLFLIGAGLSRKAIKAVGVKPFLQGVILWVVISVTALWAVTSLAV